MKALEPTLRYARWLPEAGRPITELAARELELIAAARAALDALVAHRAMATREVLAVGRWTREDITAARELAKEMR